MTPTLEERAKAIVDYAWCKRTTEDPPLIDIALAHLRAVEREATKAAYERAADVAESELDAARAWVEYGFVILKAFSRTAQKIRALADGGSDA